MSDDLTRTQAVVPGTPAESDLPEPPTHPSLPAVWSGCAALIPGRLWPVGFVLLDDFEVEGVLGQGGMGVVYRVRQRSTNRRLAVKRARLTDPGNRRRFLAELQLWIDLPAHPHLATCRFFRTIDDEVVIFMDLAEGGSLADLITQQRLTELPDVLDVAIQVAVGLHALHECGLVHQDVKPANVLVQEEEGFSQRRKGRKEEQDQEEQEGEENKVPTSSSPSSSSLPLRPLRLCEKPSSFRVKLTDFGLARARARAVAPLPGQPGQSILVSSGAMTPAYCSPEQGAGRAVSRRTDVWSWGVLLLETIVGRVPCCDSGGPSAGAVLERHLRTVRQPASRNPIPSELVDVLRSCFREDPGERWPTLADVVEVLTHLYRERTGRDYPRPIPAPVASPAERPAIGSGQWDPPRKWLRLAFQEAGRDPTEVDSILPAPAASSRAQAVADLSAYDEARQLLQRLIDDGRHDLEPRLAELRLQKALVHLSAGDSPGALELFDQSISAWHQQIHGWRKHECTPHLVAAYLHKASALRTLGDNEQSVELCDTVIRLWHGLSNRRARRDLRDDLAAAYHQKGLALRNLSRPREASALFDRSIELWEQLVEAEGQSAPANDLAQAYLSKANVLAARGEVRPALELCDRAIHIRQKLARDGQPRREADLARALLIKAGVLRSHDRARHALPLYEQAIDCWQRLVESGRDDLAHELARAHLSRANADRTLGEARQAADGCARAAAIWERLVHQEGRRELTLHLARAYQHRSNTLRVCGEQGEALHCADLAIALWERLVCSEERTDLGNDLARACVSKAILLRQSGRLVEALTLYDRACALRRQLIQQTDREDVEGDLARDAIGRAEILVELGDREKGKEELASAVTHLTVVARRDRRKDLAPGPDRANKLLLGLTEPVTEGQPDGSP